MPVVEVSYFDVLGIPVAAAVELDRIDAFRCFSFL